MKLCAPFKQIIPRLKDPVDAFLPILTRPDLVTSAWAILDIVHFTSQSTLLFPYSPRSIISESSAPVPSGSAT